MKDILRSLVPPALVAATRPLRRALFPPDMDLEYAPDGWRTRLDAGVPPGYHSPSVVRAEVAWWEPVIRDARAGRRVRPVTFNENLQQLRDQIEEQARRMTFAYTMARLAQRVNPVRVLDYGGALAPYYWHAREAVPGVALDYHCKELPAMAAEGERITPEVTWHTDEACLDERYDLVLLNDVLQYVEPWRELLGRAARASDQYVLLLSVSAVERTPGYVAKQRFAGATGLHQVLNVADVRSTMDATEFGCVHAFAHREHVRVAGAPEQPFYFGCLYEVKR